MGLPASTLKMRAPSSHIEVSAVRSAADKDAFILFPYEIYKNDENWVPPLVMERREFLTPEKNPWLEFGSVELFLARREGKVVGRVAAINDPRFNEFHETRMGAFGMFECIDDVDVAQALLDVAAKWGHSKGFTKMWGPVNFSTNNECGILVEGFDSPPVVMMAYNPPYYASLLESCGFQKAKDLWAWILSTSVEPPEKFVRVSKKLREREGVRIRSINLKDFPNEVKRLKEIYNDAWEKNWGFVPMTGKEFDHLAAMMKQMVVPELLLMAEINGEPVAFSMTIPDANVALKAAGGRLTKWGLPIGLLKLLWASRRIKKVRVVTLGIKQGFRRRGLDAILFHDTLKIARKLGYEEGEMSWTLEDNLLINRPIEAMGGKKYKTYRMFEKSLEPSPLRPS